MTRVTAVAIIAMACTSVVAARRDEQAARPADALLAEALSQARAEHKAVFVDFGASWCGPA